MKMVKCEYISFAENFRVYSTMLGKKSSLAPLKEILRRNKVDFRVKKNVRQIDQTWHLKKIG